MWAASPNQDTLLRISPAERAVVQTIQVGSSPTGLAVGAGAVWVTNYYGQTVSRIDPSVDRVAQTIPVRSGPTAWRSVTVGVGRQRQRSDGQPHQCGERAGERYDRARRRGRDRCRGRRGRRGVSDEAGDRVVRIDPQADQVVATINVGSGPTAIAVGFGSVWVTNSLDGTVSRIDPATSAVQATI